MKISPYTSENICLLIHNLRKAQIYISAIKNQPEVSADAKQNIFNPIQNKINWSLGILERRVGTDSIALYEKYIKKADSILLDNCQMMIAAMPAENQEIIENIITSIFKGEKLQIINAE